VLDLEGTLARDASERLRRVVDECVDEGHPTIAINFARVSYVDSAGLGTVVHACVSAARRGSTVTVEGLNERLERLMVLTRTFPGGSKRGRDSAAAHPRDVIWMVWVAIAATVLVALLALFWV